MATDPPTHQESPDDRTNVVSPAKRQRLQQCFQRASELTHRDAPDFDYAHDLYSQCVANDPGNLVYVEALLDNLQRKYKNNKKGSRLSGFGGRKPFNQALTEEDWTKVFRTGMDLLKSNPWDVPTLRALAQACATNHFNEVELRYLKNALDGKPKDPDVNRHCAQSLARMGQFEMAISCWSRVAEATRSKEEPERMISELTLAKTMGVPPSAEATGQVGRHRPTLSVSDQGDVETAGQATRDEKLDATEPPHRREIRLNARQLLEKGIREKPEVLANYLKLAELHSSERRYQDAEKVLLKAIQATGSSLKLQMEVEDAKMRSARARVEVAQKRATSEKSEEARELADRLRDDLNRLELDVYAQRCQRFPDKKRLNFDLGLRLRRAGNYLAAIKSFDEARGDATCLVAATLEMGECWQQLKQYGKALRCYRAAIEKSTELDGDRRKMALYRGAVLASATNNLVDAKEWLVELHRIDAGFKDASARLDKIKGVGDNPA